MHVKKCPSSSWCWDLNPRPSGHDAPPINTRPELPTKSKIFFDKAISNQTDTRKLGHFVKYIFFTQTSSSLIHPCLKIFDGLPFLSRYEFKLGHCGSSGQNGCLLLQQFKFESWRNQNLALIYRTPQKLTTKVWIDKTSNATKSSNLFKQDLRFWNFRIK